MTEKLFSLGFQVVSGCLTPEGQELIRGKCSLALICDVTKQNDVSYFAKATSDLAAATGSEVWAVINNAGIGVGGCIDWLPLDIIQKTMNVNYLGTVSVTKAFLPLLKALKYSRVINISSCAGLVHCPLMGPYVASKHAVEGFASCLRFELLPWKIFVTNINPTFMRFYSMIPSLRYHD